jgi:hypothetical protein
LPSKWDFQQGIFMKKLFSDRFGIKPAEGPPQIGSMDALLREALWKVFYIEGKVLLGGWRTHPSNPLFLPMCHTFNQYVIEVGYVGNYKRDGTANYYSDFLQGNLLDMEWWQVYDLIEYILEYSDKWNRSSLDKEMQKICRGIQLALDRHNAGYSLMNGNFIPVSSKPERDAIVEILSDGRLGQVQQHISTASEYARSDDEMHWRNAVKESSSAVEGITHLIAKNESSGVTTQVATMKKELGLHPVLGKQVIDFYGWACDVARHNLKNGGSPLAPVTIEDARYSISMACSLINLVKLKAPTECGLK